MAWNYLDVADFLLIAEAVLDIPAVEGVRIMLGVWQQVKSLCRRGRTQPGNPAVAMVEVPRSHGRAHVAVHEQAWTVSRAQV